MKARHSLELMNSRRRRRVLHNASFLSVFAVLGIACSAGDNTSGAGGSTRTSGSAGVGQSGGSGGAGVGGSGGAGVGGSGASGAGASGGAGPGGSGGSGGAAAGGSGGAGVGGSSGAGGSGGSSGAGGSAGKADASVADTGVSTPDTSTIDARTADSSTGVDSRDAGSPPTDSGGGGGPADGATPSPGCGSTTTQSGTFSMMVSGANRTYILKLPTTYNANTPYRLIFAFHHLTGNAAGVASRNYYGMDTPAYANGRAIFIAPEGSDTGNGELGWPDKGGVDMAFARALLDWARANLCVDTSRIFSTGWSYGGMFSEKLGCQLPDVFRAIAPMSASLMGGTSSCVKHNIAAWIAHGDMDATVSLASGIAARDYFLTLNHCTMTTAPTTPSPCVEYSGCDTGYPVHWCQFAGGHTTASFAAAGIWPFFSQF
jgi:polyhydroxybutyrate depolymerase